MAVPGNPATARVKGNPTTATAPETRRTAEARDTPEAGKIPEAPGSPAALGNPAALDNRAALGHPAALDSRAALDNPGAIGIPGAPGFRIRAARDDSGRTTRVRRPNAPRRPGRTAGTPLLPGHKSPDHCALPAGLRERPSRNPAVRPLARKRVRPGAAGPRP